MKQRLILSAFIIILIMLTGCMAQESNREKVIIGVGAQHAIVYLDFDVASALGAFEEEGLDVELQYFGGGSDAANALIGGSVDFSGNAIDHALKAQVRNENLRMVHNILESPCVTMIVRSDLADEIKSPADLAGRKVGITRLGSATHILSVQIAANAGVAAEQLVIVEVGGSTMPAAIEAKAIDVAMGVAPFTTKLVDAGDAKVLVDLCQPEEAEAAIGGGLPFTGMLTRDSVLAERPEVAQKVVNAMVKAHKFIMSHTAEEIADILPDDVAGDDRETYIKALDANLSAFNTSGGVINPEGFDVLLRIHKTFGSFEEGTEIDIDALYTNDLVEAAQD